MQMITNIENDEALLLNINLYTNNRVNQQCLFSMKFTILQLIFFKKINHLTDDRKLTPLRR
tara:strand:+ start:2876 stop:3058 length:183 start_codon:yes stop_codon:yes gene_type:complete